jgi:carbamoyl-phosphate synthase small subunit
MGHISIGDEAIKAPIPEYSNDSASWISNVSTKEIKTYNPNGSLKIALIDCGAKQNIIRCLAERDAQVTVFPHDFDFSKALSEFHGTLKYS